MLLHQVSKAVGLHPNTIIRLEKWGVISPSRDWNGWRRYSEKDLEKLQSLVRGEIVVKKKKSKQRRG